MIDLFDIINNRKDRRINIKGEVVENGLLFDTEYINELIELVLANEDEVETTKFKVREVVKDRSSIEHPRPYEESMIKCIEFEIDMHVTNSFYNKVESHLEDFIDYYTIGSIVYDHYMDEAMITVDTTEEYMSRNINIESPRVDVVWDDYRRWSETLDESYSDWQIGSYPRLEIDDRIHDADGDVVFAASFDTRPADMTNMFSNMNLTLDTLELFDSINRPVINGGDR